MSRLRERAASALGLALQGADRSRVKVGSRPGRSVGMAAVQGGGLLLATLLLAPASVAVAQGQDSQGQGSQGQGANACPGDNGGLTLSPGFCATVFADKVGHVRHMVVAPNGTVYANTWSGVYYHNDTPPAGGFLLALRDTNSAGKADQIVRFGPTQAQGNAGGTGVAIHNNYLYAETNDKVVRYALPANGGAPTGQAQVVVSGMPLGGDHPMHPMAIDAHGTMYVDMGSATNACQSQNRIAEIPGNNPCTELQTRGGIWAFDSSKLNQKFSPAQRFITGLRNGEAVSFDSAGRIFATQHGRDQLFENWPKLYDAKQGAEEPAEELVQLQRGRDFGWPECYYDIEQKKLVLAPEYGGDGGKKVGVCAQKQAPVAAFPGHYAPNDMLIYEGKDFPAAYKDGAFIAFHGSWNRAPLPQGGYNVVFQPLHDGKAAGGYVVFADGFDGGHKDPGSADHRPTGLAVGPDGSLYIADDQGGRIWRVTYTGGNRNQGIAASAPAPAGTQTAANGQPLPPEGMHSTAGLPIPPGGSPDQVALGEQIFHGQAANGTCAGCHGMDAKGSSAGPNLVDGKWIWGDGSVQAISNTITHGVPKPKDHTGNMPPLGGSPLTPAEVTAVADYVWAISHQNQH